MEAKETAGDVTATAGDIAEMSPRLPEMLRRRCRNLVRAEVFFMFDFDFFKYFSSLQQVSETSPRNLHQLRRRRSRRLILSATGETSPRPAGNQGDCERRRKDIATTSGDVAETSTWLPEMLPEMSPQLPEMSQRRPRDFRANWLSLCLGTSLGRLLYSESFFSWSISIFFFSSQSPPGLGHISAKSPSVAATSIAETNFVRNWGNVSETGWRPRRLPKTLQRHRHDCRRCCGDVAATEKTSRKCHHDFRVNWLSLCLQMSPRRLQNIFFVRAQVFFMFEFDFFSYFSSLQQVSETSPRNLHRLWRSTSIADTIFASDWGDVSKACWRPRSLPKTSPRLRETLRWRRRDCRRCCGDVTATEKTSRRCRHDVSETSPWWQAFFMFDFDFFFFFFFFFFFLFPVSSRSRRHLRHISSISCGDVDRGD